jgi:hypothetical protein
MEDIPDMDIIHFLQLCKYIDSRPVPYFEQVEVKKRPSAWSRRPQSIDTNGEDTGSNNTVEVVTSPQTMNDLTTMLGGIR